MFSAVCAALTLLSRNLRPAPRLPTSSPPGSYETHSCNCPCSDVVSGRGEAVENARRKVRGGSKKGDGRVSVLIPVTPLEGQGFRMSRCILMVAGRLFFAICLRA